MRIVDLKLQELKLFHGATQTEIDKFIESTRSFMKRYEKGERIMQAFDENKYIGMIVEGKAQVIAEDRFGNESMGHTVVRGNLLGITSSVLEEELNFTSIDALTSVIVLWVPYKALLYTAGANAKVHGIIMKNLIEAIASKLVLMMEKIEVISQKSLRERLKLYLTQQMKYQKSEKVQIPGRIQLAKILGCNRSALTREISLMKKDGILDVGDDWMRLSKECWEIE